MTKDIGGLRLLELRVDENGDVDPDGEQALNNELDATEPTDLLLPATSAGRSVTLLQGAFSHFAFAASLPFDARRSGALNGKDARVDGPIIACYSEHDSAVGTLYPLASLLGREDAAGLDDATYRWGGIGHDGHQPDVSAMPLLEVGSRYDFAGHRLVNIDAAAVVKNGSPPSGAHSDIVHPELAWVVVSAGGLVG